mgnify:FL=1
MSKKAKSNRSKSRRTTPWDEAESLTSVQRFIKMHYQTRYEERHQPLSDHLEKVEKMINLVFENPKLLKYRDQFGSKP